MCKQVFTRRLPITLRRPLQRAENLLVSELHLVDSVIFPSVPQLVGTKQWPCQLGPRRHTDRNIIMYTSSSSSEPTPLTHTQQVELHYLFPFCNPGTETYLFIIVPELYNLFLLKMHSVFSFPHSLSRRSGPLPCTEDQHSLRNLHLT